MSPAGKVGPAPRRAAASAPRALIVGLALTVASTLLALVAVEVALRIVYPFSETSWPGLHRRFGFTLRPGKTVRWTNLRDFSVEQQANSLGFLDREPPAAPDVNAFRVLVLGDSFVEGAQIELPQKTHRLLEARLRAAFPARTFRVDAMGASGSGTSDELAFYGRFKDRYRPDLVIVLFVNNDFANNSLLLEAVRNGWDPAHSPRPYFTRVDGAYRAVTVDREWSDHLLQTAAAPRPARPASVLQRLAAYSTTAAWIRARLADPAAGRDDLQSARLATLRADPAYRAAFAGWEFPADEDMDAMFFAETMPPVFDDAVAVTGHVLDELRTLAARDGFRLLLVATDNCSSPPQPRKRRLRPDALLARLRGLASSRELALLDLGEYFRAHAAEGPTRFSRDGHWNPAGHRLASQAIGDYLVAHAREYLALQPR